MNLRSTPPKPFEGLISNLNDNLGDIMNNLIWDEKSVFYIPNHSELFFAWLAHCVEEANIGLIQEINISYLIKRIENLERLIQSDGK